MSLERENDFAKWARKAATQETDAGGFAGLGEFLQAVAKTKLQGKGDERLHAARQKATMVEGTDSLGGFLVAPEMSSQIWVKAIENSIFLGKGMTLRMKSDSLLVPALDETSRSSSLYGGIHPYWVEETGTKPESEPKFAQLKLIPKKLVVRCKVSTELLEDAPAVQPLLYDIVGKAIGFTLDESFIRGTGAGQPLGFMNSGSLITVNKFAGQAMDTIIFRNCLDMFQRIPGDLKSGAIWVANNDAFGQIYQMNVIVGAGGGPVMLANNGAYGELPQSIFGRPLMFSEKAETLGDLGDFFAVCPSQYLIGLRKELTMKMSEHLGLLENVVYFVFEVRVDGQPLWEAPLTPRRSAETVSPFVTLEERA